MEMGLRNKTTSEFRTVWTGQFSPLGVPASQVSLYIQIMRFLLRTSHLLPFYVRLSSHIALKNNENNIICNIFISVFANTFLVEGKDCLRGSLTIQNALVFSCGHQGPYVSLYITITCHGMVGRDVHHILLYYMRTL